MDFTFRVTPALKPLGLEDFPNEFRPYAVLNNTVTIFVPNGYNYLSSQFVMMQEGYSSNSATNYFSGAVSYPAVTLVPGSITTVPGGQDITYTGLGSSGCWPLMDLSYNNTLSPTAVIRMMFQPDCDAPASTTFSWNPQYTQQIQSTSTYQNTVPVTPVQVPVGVTHVSSSMSVTGPSSVNIVGNTATFTYTLLNSSSSTLYAPWIAFEDPAGAVQFTGLAGPVVGLSSTYGAGNKLFLLNPIGPNGSVSFTLSVSVTAAGCISSGNLPGVINLKFGYQCTAPLSFTDPANASCQKGTAQFNYTIYPAAVNIFNQVFPTGSASLCGGQLSYTFDIQNAQPGTLGDPTFAAVLPPNVTIAGASFYYPSTASVPTATVGSSTPVPIGTGLGWHLQTYIPALSSSGGLTGVGTAPNNKVRVTITLQFNCGYNPNNPVQFLAGGLNTCGQLISDLSSLHYPSITGAPAADALTLSLSVSNASLNCTSTEQVTLTVSNTGPATVHTNWAVITVPAPLSVSSVSPPVAPVGNTYSWQIPPGFTGTASYTLNIGMNNVIYCGTVQLASSLSYSETLNCSSSSCPINYTYASPTQPIYACCSDPCAGVSVTPDHKICAGSPDVLTATGGGAYYWLPGAQTTASITVTPTATTTYTVIVTPGSSSSVTCTAMVTVLVSPKPVVTIISSGPVCSSGTATLTANVTSGSSPYTYLWSNGGTAAVQTGLTAGTYSVLVTDLNGCTGTASFAVTQSPPIVPLYGIFEPCSGQCNGTITVTVLNGAGPFTYSWQPGGEAPNSSSIGGLCAGTYTLTITDVNGCTLTQTVTISSAPPITVSLSQTPACFGSGGIATAAATGGTPGYTYQWLPSGGSNATATGLSPGTYTCIVTDSKGCTSAASIAVQNTIISIAGASCKVGYITPGGNPCTAFNPVVTGGAAPLSYLWSTGATTQNVNVCVGVTTTYTFTVTDANGCSATQSFTFNVIDARCGHGKVYVCFNNNSICMAVAAANAFLAANPSAHLGPCTLNDPCNNQRLAADSLLGADQGYFGSAPNPFSHSTTLSYAFDHDEDITIRVFDLAGHVIGTVCKGHVMADEKLECEFSSGDLPSGIYIAELYAGVSGRTYHLKLVLQK
jgi:hypothetical protein